LQKNIFNLDRVKIELFVMTGESVAPAGVPDIHCLPHVFSDLFHWRMVVQFRAAEQKKISWVIIPYLYIGNEGINRSSMASAQKCGFRER
jgi:hypothetical protein